jgi:hypothetical protein
MTDKPKSSEEFEKFDKAMDKIMSVSKAELDRRLEVAKKAKTGKRYPKSKTIEISRLLPVHAGRRLSYSLRRKPSQSNSGGFSGI